MTEEKANTIQETWEAYCVNLPDNASPIQIRETRRAFYGGAYSMLILMTRLSAEEVSLDGGAHIFQGLLDEAADFFQAIIKSDQERAKKKSGIITPGTDK
jgi:hypothetical protein